MTSKEQQDLAGAILRGAARRYFASRRARVDAFVDRHFTLAGSLALHRRAIGWDLVRAPVNLFLTGPALMIVLAALLARRAGLARWAAWLSRRRILLDTNVTREIEWLVATELLAISCDRRDPASYRDAIAATILRDLGAAERLDPVPGMLTGTDADLRHSLSAAIESYLGTRSAVAEITTGLTAAGIGALATKHATPGLATLSSALAGMIAQQSAIAAFPLGASLGACWYGLFPASASPALLAVTMGSVFLSGALLAAFSGILADPLQRRLGLHRRRLIRLLQGLEDMLCGDAARSSTMRDHYVARLVDIFDLAALAMRASHA